MRKALEGRGSEAESELMAGICKFGKLLSKFEKVHELLEGKDWFWGKKHGKEQKWAIGDSVTWIACRAISKEVSKLLEKEGEKPREKFDGDGASVIWVGAFGQRTYCSRLVTLRRPIVDVLGFVESRVSTREWGYLKMERESKWILAILNEMVFLRGNHCGVLVVKSLAVEVVRRGGRECFSRLMFPHFIFPAIDYFDSSVWSSGRRSFGCPDGNDFALFVTNVRAGEASSQVPISRSRTALSRMFLALSERTPPSWFGDLLWVGCRVEDSEVGTISVSGQGICTGRSSFLRENIEIVGKTCLTEESNAKAIARSLVKMESGWQFSRIGRPFFWKC
jgi:hypothetical protein